MKTLVVLSFIALCFSEVSFSEVINFPKLHQKKLNASSAGQIIDLKFGGTNILWMIDREYLWRWNYLSGSLKKITLNNARSNNLHKMKRDQENLIIFGEKVFFILNTRTLQIKRISNPSHGISGPLQTESDGFSWSDHSSSWRYSYSQKKLKRIAALSGVMRSDLVSFAAKSQKTFVARGNLIIEYSRSRKGKLRSKVIHKTNSKITEIKKTENSNLFFISEKEVIKLDSDGRIVQAIPLLGSSGMLANMTEKRHAYLLPSQKSLEIFDLNNRSKTVIPISFGRIRGFDIKTKFVVILEGRYPVVVRDERII